MVFLTVVRHILNVCKKWFVCSVCIQDIILFLLKIAVVLLSSYCDLLNFLLAGKPGFTKKQADLFFPPDFADDFPVAMQVSSLANCLGTKWRQSLVTMVQLIQVLSQLLGIGCTNPVLPSHYLGPHLPLDHKLSNLCSLVGIILCWSCCCLLTTSNRVLSLCPFYCF